jgi:lipopolysaccharide transport system ATP-binding protein
MVILKAENISKQYRLGVVGTGTLSHDINRWWHKIRGKEDPYLKIGEANSREEAGSSPYVWALKDINFEVQQGEVLGIIGKNGAGKSTLLKILSKVTNPTTGIIKSRGRIASLLEVGTGFHPELTGRENVFLNGAILGMTKAEIRAKLDEIISFSGCERYIDTPVKRYSSGMKVRLAFAVAAHLEPEILVVDEVLAVGDAEFQKKAIGKMQDISRGEGRTVLFVSHNMAAVQSLCTRSILLEGGALTYEGKTEDVIVNYLKTSLSNTIIEQNNRKGNGKVKVISVDIYGSDNGIAPSTGSELNIVITLENPLEIPYNRMQFDIRIDNNFGQRLSWFSTQMKDLSTEKAPTSLTFQLPTNPFNSGTYYATFHLQVDNEVSDWVQNAFNFTVEQGDFYGLGKVVPLNQSNILLDYNILIS